jgi:mono/diheme cytochrome c family protein
MGAVLAFSLLGGCRGQERTEESLYVVGDDMALQPKVRPETASAVFSDGRGMRPLVEGTVARGELREDDAYYRGGTTDAAVAFAPIQMSESVLERGEERFNIYCSVCHDHAGSGHGLVVQHGYPLPVDLASDHVRGLKDGEIFQTITNGIRNMPSYRSQIPVEDRWAIVMWVRVLGRSQHASPEDVPPDMQGRIEPKEVLQ